MALKTQSSHNSNTKTTLHTENRIFVLEFGMRFQRLHIPAVASLHRFLSGIYTDVTLSATRDSTRQFNGHLIVSKWYKRRVGCRFWVKWCLNTPIFCTPWSGAQMSTFHAPPLRCSHPTMEETSILTCWLVLFHGRFCNGCYARCAKTEDFGKSLLSHLPRHQ